MSGVSDFSTSADVDKFIGRWSGREGGQERANYALFLSELCDVIGVDRPDVADATHEHNDYVFERYVKRTRADGTTDSRRIDLYKRDCFILEAKQSRLKGPKRLIGGQGDLFAPEGDGNTQISGLTWDILMINARRQAEHYARALPANHAYPLFILTCDVGRTIEVFADFSGNGRHYSHFPDAQSFQIQLENLRDTVIQDRLRRIWTAPRTLDPTQQTAKITREIAGRLAEISKALESRGIDPGQAALLLMRCLFTMFVEDVGLLKKGSFTNLLSLCAKDPKRFAPDMEDLWKRMDKGTYSPAIGQHLLQFNGKLFKQAKAFPLTKEEILRLKNAAEADWRDLEPAIFGSLFEQALDPEERKRLGAHYTPRAYVERLVNATIMEPLEDQWTVVESSVERRLEDGSKAAAVRDIEDFLKDLSKTRVLDPACGTGNFLYVSLKQMKGLEGKALKALHDLGGDEAVRNLENISVKPHQFFGMEINARAVQIAELVLWVGYIQWHLRTLGEPPIEPIIDDRDHVVEQDALLNWDNYPNKALKRDSLGRPVTRQNAEGVQIEDYIYPNSERRRWPDADFIIGNPPFIGKGGAMRLALGDSYIENLWDTYTNVNKSADYVMFWWNRAAEILTDKESRLRRFGFVTTNSVTQVFNRRVLERHLKCKNPISIILAIPDHPWTKATKDAAAVRIAMTVGVAGTKNGILRKVVGEEALDSDDPIITFHDTTGKINADLTVGADVTGAHTLIANEGIACNGMMLAGQGFVLNSTECRRLIEKSGGKENDVIKPFLKGRDLLHNIKTGFVIDLYGFGREEARRRFPAIYQHMLEKVKPERDKKRDRAFREKWWLFGRQRPAIRSGLKNLSRYIATTETAKHRVFQFVDTNTVPDHMIIAIALEDAYHLGVLTSRIHIVWSLRLGGWLGVGNDPRYSKSRCFDPFPFPETTETIKNEFRELAEELDHTRRAVLAQHKDLSLTGLYNVLEQLKREEKLSKKEEDIKARGRVLILKDLHEQIDSTAFRAYGWKEALTDEEILEKLVALNAEREAEERRGFVRWLRPSYQIERFGLLAHSADKVQSITVGKRIQKKKPFPKDHKDQTADVITLLRSADVPLTPAIIASQYKNAVKAEADIQDVLFALQRTGAAESFDDGRSFVSAV